MFQSTFKNFTFSFEGLGENQTVSSGALIAGHISFCLTKPTKITSITMALTGGVRVHWSTGGGKKSRRRHYSASLSYFDFNTALLQDNAGAAVRATLQLQPGTHVYPFTCQIPHGDFPSTFHGPHGHITYTLTVGINRPWHMTKTFKTDLNFAHHIDTNQPDMPAPLSGSNSMTMCGLWCASSPITLKASTEKKAFIPGETVKMICVFSNSSSRTATPKLKLQQKQTYYTHNKVSRATITKELASVVGNPVGAHTSGQHAEIRITIPPNAAHSINNCAILEVEYFIQASLCAKPCQEVVVLFPIVLCGTPVRPLYAS